jgi:BMFP domain-containing protein YqiC
MRDDRFFEDMAKVASGALGALGTLRGEVEAMARQRRDRLIADLDLATRDELATVDAVASAARTEQEQLTARVAALEARLAALEARLGPATSSESP